MELLSLTVLTDSLVFMSNAVGSVFSLLHDVESCCNVCLFVFLADLIHFLFSLFIFFLIFKQYQSTI